MTTATKQNLLQVEGLTVDFDAGKPTAHRALDGVSLSIGEGESVALVGESGSGKTVLARTILGMQPQRASIRSREMHWKGEDMNAFSTSRRQEWRRDSVAVIWQNPQGSLVPVYPIGKQMHWLLKLQGEESHPAREKRMHELLEHAGLRDPGRITRQLPENLSGGECQRIMVAMALSRKPQLLIADEPTSNLDVKLQAEILTLIQSIASELQFAMLFITHDLVIASRLSTKTAVLYRGELVEEGPTKQVFQNPQSDYTKTLIESATLHSHINN
jgi:ABC-type glutathione transport system ATPase component